MTTQTMDPAKAEAFAGQMLGILNGSILALMTSVGHRTGLFETMADCRRPPRRDRQGRRPQRALRARMARRDGGGGIVEIDPGQRPTTCRRSTRRRLRAAGPDNLAAFAQLIGLFGGVEDGSSSASARAAASPTPFPVPEGDGGGQRAGPRRAL